MEIHKSRVVAAVRDYRDPDNYDAEGDARADLAKRYAKAARNMEDLLDALGGEVQMLKKRRQELGMPDPGFTMLAYFDIGDRECKLEVGRNNDVLLSCISPAFTAQEVQLAESMWKRIFPQHYRIQHYPAGVIWLGNVSGIYGIDAEFAKAKKVLLQLQTVLEI